MAFKVAVHSFKGGTGKSTLSANIATLLALSGRKVGVVDLDLAGPGLHVIFQLESGDVRYTLNDVILKRCNVDDPIIDLTPKLGLKNGRLLFIPASYKAEDIVKVLADGFEIGAFRRILEAAMHSYDLDYLIIDTHPGIEKSTLLSIGICDLLLLITRLDSQDIFGTSVIREIAKTLRKPEILIANMVPPGIDSERLQERLATIFPAAPSAVIPFYNDVLKLLSSEVFVIRNPDHEFTSKLSPVLKQLEMAPRQQISS